MTEYIMLVRVTCIHDFFAEMSTLCSQPLCGHSTLGHPSYLNVALTSMHCPDIVTFRYVFLSDQLLQVSSYWRW